MEEQQDEVTLDLSEFLDIVRKRKKLIISITFGAAILAALISLFVIKPTYESTVSLVIGKPDSELTNSNGYNNSDIQMYQKLVKTYAKIAASKYVADETIKALNLDMTYDQFSSLVKVEPQVDTQILDIKVDNNDPKLARDIAQILTEKFIERSQYLIPKNEIKVMDKAEIAEKPIKPNKKLNTAIAFFLGLLVSIGIAFMQEYMDKTIKGEKDLERLVDLPVIGVIPQHKTE